MANKNNEKYKVTKKSNNIPSKDKNKDIKKEQNKQNKEVINNNIPPKPTVLEQIMPYFIIVFAALIALFIYLPDLSGTVGGALHGVFFGIFSGATYAIPIFLIIHAIVWITKVDKKASMYKFIYTFITTINISIVLHLFANGDQSFSIATHYSNGNSVVGGGVIGGIIGEALRVTIGTVGASIIAFSAIIVFSLMIFDITPRSIYISVAYKIKTSKEDRKFKSIDDDDFSDTDTQFTSKVRITSAPKNTTNDELVYKEQKSETVKKNTKFNPDIPLDDDDGVPAVTIKEKPKKKDVMFKGKFNPDVELDDDDFNNPKEDILEAETPSTNVPNHSFTFEYASSVEEKYAPTYEGRPIEANDPKNISMDDYFGNSNTENANNENHKSIFANPDDAKTLDKITESYLKGNTKTVSLSDGVNASGAKDVSNSELDVKEINKQLQEASSPKKTKIGKRAYRFPPIDLLYQDTSPKNEDIREELYGNADKLVETLKSFKVSTKIVDVSRGPTITRYELVPEAGTRVRQIANLVDDISLSLATTGVRIEAPIPGKSAVGIEVPNKNAATVHLRTLLEDKVFKANKSNLYVALGEDVAGASIYFDIAKMPHLLIAGATGMGKSVCINTIVISLLYKAAPSDVKLILIDPKKVELNIYNGLPHLLTPVVSDPKKAAGSLSWAVNEMEKRFSLIEDVGVRDLKSYNEVIKDDPDKEQLPQIVIIIDELADLMMTAPDDVEKSICRLAQKARAAGMHLIIGTQRPSVDVITGLIKSNIPSRIAFTVASQIDSRTIIDRAGAESLIGRGDMLFNPVGAQKPIRVQGAFVDTEYVEKVVQFIKDNSGETEYNDEVIKEIESEAAKCGLGNKKGSAGAEEIDSDETDEDPKFREAVIECINAGRASTSLLQRRISVGYGRAAKLIDRMGDLGYISPSDGTNKPRKVLITLEQFQEITINSKEE